MEKLIVLSNDDGIDAPGLQYLISFLKPLGKLVVLAPESAMSGMSHAVTIKTPLRLKKLNSIDGVERYSSNGTPVDCIKLALDIVLKRKPDLIVSGINHGSNSSINILYSGTMAVAIEGAMLNIPSIGFSAVSYEEDYDMKHFESWVQKISLNTLKNGLPKATCLNVNFPDSNEIKGIKTCRQAIGYWKEDFETRIDTRKQKYYWLKGKFVLPDKDKDSDEDALKNGFISIVPTSIDLTAYDYIDTLSKQLKKE